MWATGSLRYSSQWDFYSKQFETNAFGKLVPTNGYFRFQGLFSIDQEQNVKALKDKSANDCKELCNDDPKCMSFSFHQLDHACLMGIAKVRYAKGWVYYERNKRPAKEGEQWAPYPMELDAYHRSLKSEEEKTMTLFAERDRKQRISREKKEGVVKYKMNHMEKKRKRLDKEMQVKGFAREQARKKWHAVKKERQADQDAAAEKGKFDEAFHKQASKNKELLHKRKVERSVKLNFMSKLNEKEHKKDLALKAHIATVKARQTKEISEKNQVIAEKERQQKLKVKKQAGGMKTQAFKLVIEERKFKSKVKNTKRVKQLKKVQDAERRKQWDVADATQRLQGKEKEAKRKIKMEKEAQLVQLKLANEKAAKKPATNKVPAIDDKPKTKVPTKPAKAKAAKLQATAPGNSKRSSTLRTNRR